MRTVKPVALIAVLASILLTGYKCSAGIPHSAGPVTVTCKVVAADRNPAPSHISYPFAAKLIATNTGDRRVRYGGFTVTPYSATGEQFGDERDPFTRARHLAAGRTRTFYTGITEPAAKTCMAQALP